MDSLQKDKLIKEKNDKQHKIKMSKLTEDNIQIINEDLSFIQLNNSKIEDYIQQNIDKLLLENEDFNLTNLNLLSLYDKNKKIIKYNLQEIQQSKEFWNTKLDEYIESLEQKLKQNIDDISKKELKELILKNNADFFNFITNIRANALNLADKDTRSIYVERLAGALMDLQAREIQNIGLDKFLNTDLKKEPHLFKYFMNVEDLQKIQKDGKRRLREPKEKYEVFFKLLHYKTKKDVVLALVFDDILSFYRDEQEKVVNKLYLDEQNFYDERKKKYDKIDELLKQTVEKYTQTEKNIQNNLILKVNNNIPKGYSYIDNRIQKELERLENKKKTPVNLDLDFQSFNYKGMGHKKPKIKTPVFVIIGINNDIDIISDRLTAIDKFVLNRAFSLWQINNKHLTPELIYKDFINKNVDVSQIGENIYNAIANSIDKLKVSTICFIFKDPNTIKRLGLSSEEIEFLGKESYILPLEKTFVKYKNGRVSNVYTYLVDKPLYFYLAEKINQIKTNDRKFIPEKTGFNWTLERMLLADYLSRHIRFLIDTKNNPKYDNKLSYEKIFNKCDLLVNIEKGTPKYRKYKSKYINDIKSLLTYHKQKKNIKDFEEYPKETKRKKGIIIEI